MLTLTESAEGCAIKGSLMVGAFNHCGGHLGSFRLHLTLYTQKPLESNRGADARVEVRAILGSYESRWTSPGRQREALGQSSLLSSQPFRH